MNIDSETHLLKYGYTSCNLPFETSIFFILKLRAKGRYENVTENTVASSAIAQSN